MKDLFLKSYIIEVAKHFEEPYKFKASAKIIANKIEVEEAKLLTKYFHNNPEEPEYLKATIRKYGTLGVWMDICQNAILEILYNFKEAIIPTLYEIGFGKYDWTQYKAIDKICQLASEGIATETTINKLDEEILSFRYEALLPCINSLTRIKHDSIPPIYEKVFNELKEDVIDGLEVIQCLAVNYPDKARLKIPYLLNAVETLSNETRSPLLDGAVMQTNEDGTVQFFQNGIEITESYNEQHIVFILSFCYQLNPENKEVNKLIDYWKNNAVNMDHRKQLENLAL